MVHEAADLGGEGEVLKMATILLTIRGFVIPKKCLAALITSAKIVLYDVKSRP